MKRNLLTSVFLICAIYALLWGIDQKKSGREFRPALHFSSPVLSSLSEEFYAETHGVIHAGVAFLASSNII